MGDILLYTLINSNGSYLSIIKKKYTNYLHKKYMKKFIKQKQKTEIYPHSGKFTFHMSQ